MDGLLDTSAPPAAGDRLKPRDFEPRELFQKLSHEFCRPLISLRAGFDLLLAGCEGPISQDQRGHVQELRAHCDDLIRLTRTYLDFAGLDRSSRTPEWGSFRLGALLEEVARQFAGRAAVRGIAWECRLEGPDATVRTDLAHFQQILGCLIENALDHTPEGGWAGVTARFDADSWQVEVSDDGSGIPARDIDRVFEPLVRLKTGSHAAAGSRDGLGMGLAVCRELVAHLGGEIHLRSSAEAGTAVKVRFSFAKES